MSECDVAQRDVVKLIREIAAIARGSAQSDALSEDERAELFKQRRRMANGASEVMKIIKEHPHEHAQAHAMDHLRRAIGAAFTIGMCATLNPTLVRRDSAKAANARKSRADQSKSIDEEIARCARILGAKSPRLKNNQDAMATRLAEGATFNLGKSAIVKRLRALRKDGRLS